MTGEMGYDARWDLVRVKEVGDRYPEVMYVKSDWMERDYWRCLERPFPDKSMKIPEISDAQGDRHVYIPVSMGEFRIFRWPSRGIDRRYYWIGRQEGYDVRWNLWNDTFKRGIFYKAIKFLRKMGVRII